MTHWKILRDPYFAALCAERGEQAVWDAGFFFDDDPEPAALDDVDWLCTPLPRRPVRGARPAVLLSTGGFSPLHAGHLQMMESARVAAIEAGYDVLGGYLSPGHDAYLRLKCGADTVHVDVRLKQCAEALADSDWLSMDPWEAMHRRVAVNFTDVAARLRAYLRAHVDPRVEVLYVCGADNARFAAAFCAEGHCIVVGRPGAEPELARVRAQLADAPYVTFVAGHHPAASRAMRGVPAPRGDRPRLVVRMEDARAVRTLGGVPLATFQSELLQLLAQHVSARVVPLVDAPSLARVINLDAMVTGGQQLAISRLFALGGYQAHGFVARPGAAPLHEQVARIPAGAYVLADDDRVTGSTLAAVRALLPAQVEIEGVQLAVRQAADEDVVDARDFLLGADDGGLVLSLPGGTVGRAPYLLPYVDPAARASISASHRFSIDVWALNARLFAPTGLTVGDLPAPARAAMLGWPADTALAQLCDWHAARLKHIVALSAMP